jgi:succinoglycan biosynthesis protein ExoM
MRLPVSSVHPSDVPMTTRVCLGIPTFRRIDLLRNLLVAIGRLAPLPDGIAFEVAVFDNDPDASAKTMVEEMMNDAAAPFAMHYCHVSEPGLSNVRNAALSFAESGADVLAMIDDDEIPEGQWLNELLRVRKLTGAEVVVGPVHAIFPDGTPSWIRACRDHEWPALADCAVVDDGWSGNFLLDLAKVAPMRLRFDPSMNHTGGEDQLFFRQIALRGGVIRYAASAIAWEYLPASRRSLSTILKRSFRRGGSLTDCDRRTEGSFRKMLLRLAKGSGLVILGFAKVMPILLACGAATAVVTLCEIARGLGMLAAFIGVRYEAYGKGAC